MKILQTYYNFQEVAHFGIQIIGRLVMVGVIIVLVSMWVVTESLYGLSKWIQYGENAGTKNKFMVREKRETGLA